MGLADIILFPLYVLIFYFIFSFRRKRITDPALRKYHLHLFWLKALSSIAFTVFYAFIAGGGDSTTLYYPEGKSIFWHIVKDFSNIKYLFMPGSDIDESLIYDPKSIGYFKGESNFLVIKVVTLLCPFTFARYLLINLMFSLIAFTGAWRLFKFFTEQYPHLHKKFAIAIIYLPTFIFWSSGILKDPLCITAMGWLTYSIYSLLYKREKIFQNIIIIIIAGYALATLKIYILVSYLPFLLLFILLKNIRHIKSIIVKICIGAVTFVLVGIGFFLISSKLEEELGRFAIDNIAESVQKQQTTFINMADKAESSFSLGVEFDGSYSSMAKMAPAAIVATLFRPFLWESKKVSTLLSSLESLALMIFTLYVLFKAGPVSFFSSFFKDPMILFCFFFSIIFAIFVGATTLNFGTLVRYKIPCMPFYIIALILILEVSVKKKSNLAVDAKVA